MLINFFCWIIDLLYFWDAYVYGLPKLVLSKFWTICEPVKPPLYGK